MESIITSILSHGYLVFFGIVSIILAILFVMHDYEVDATKEFLKDNFIAVTIIVSVLAFFLKGLIFSLIVTPATLAYLFID